MSGSGGGKPGDGNLFGGLSAAQIKRIVKKEIEKLKDKS